MTSFLFQYKNILKKWFAKSRVKKLDPPEQSPDLYLAADTWDEDANISLIVQHQCLTSLMLCDCGEANSHTHV